MSSARSFVLCEFVGLLVCPWCILGGVCRSICGLVLSVVAVVLCVCVVSGVVCAVCLCGLAGLLLVFVSLVCACVSIC